MIKQPNPFPKIKSTLKVEFTFEIVDLNENTLIINENNDKEH